MIDLSVNSISDNAVRKLRGCAGEILEQWNGPVGTPTRHFVIDDFLPSEIAELAYQSFPRDGDGFFSQSSFREHKKTSAKLDQYAEILGNITYAIQDPKVIELIAQYTAIDQLEPDPLLYAGGLSMMFNGDFLNPHIDNSHDAARGRFRRLNVLYYVSPDWSLENGGNFELWDETRSQPKTIVARQNRLVVMETNRASWHSVSKVVTDRPRCCISNYYFSEMSPDGSDYFHVTSFTGRPEETAKRAIGMVDNSLRTFVSKVTKIGRGKKKINKVT